MQLSGVTINASQAHLYTINDVSEMQATIKHSKNDADGMGHRFTYAKLGAGRPGTFMHSHGDVFKCASELMPSPEPAFFAWKASTQRRKLGLLAKKPSTNC